VRNQFLLAIFDKLVLIVISLNSEESRIWKENCAWSLIENALDNSNGIVWRSQE